MSVAAEYRRQGIGSLLMKWGMDLADKIDAQVRFSFMNPSHATLTIHSCKCTVEATLEGKQLYEKFGFVVQHDVELAVPEKFASRPKQRLFMMFRQKQSLRA